MGDLSVTKTFRSRSLLCTWGGGGWWIETSNYNLCFRGLPEQRGIHHEVCRMCLVPTQWRVPSCSSDQELSRSKEGHCTWAAERRNPHGRTSRRPLPRSLSIPSCRAFPRTPLCLQMGHLQESQALLPSVAALSPGPCWASLRGTTCLQYSHRHLRTFHYPLLFILSRYKPWRQPHVVLHLSWLLGAQDRLASQ